MSIPTQAVVVMMCGPPHEKEDERGTCPAAHDGRRCYARVDHAVVVAKRENAALLVCGAASETEDVDAYVKRARAAGVEKVHPIVDERFRGTLGLLEAAVDRVARYGDFADVTDLVLVTDEWHLTRAVVIAANVVVKTCVRLRRPLLAMRWEQTSPAWNAPPVLAAREGEKLMAFVLDDEASARPAA